MGDESIERPSREKDEHEDLGLFKNESVLIQVNDITSVQLPDSTVWRIGVMFLTAFRFIFRVIPSMQVLQAPFTLIQAMKKKSITVEYHGESSYSTFSHFRPSYDSDHRNETK